MSTGAKVAVAVGVLVIAAGGALGFLVVRSAETSCLQCDFVEAKDVDGLRQALRSGQAVDPRAWRDALRLLTEGSPAGPALVRLLLEHRADPNARWTSTRTKTSSGSTQTWAAAVVVSSSGDPTFVDALVKAGLEVRGQAGAEALAAAAGQARAAHVKRLLEAGVPAHAASEGRSALAWAIQTRDLPTIAALEEAGAVEW